MSSYRELNQIFYENNKFDNPTDIYKLEAMFYDKNRLRVINVQKPAELANVDSMQEMVMKPNTVVEDVNKRMNKSHSDEVSSSASQKKWFEPHQKDSIFWCVFIEVYGYQEYLMVGTRYGNRELEEKQKMISFFKEQPKVLKNTNHKITNINIQEILSEFLSLQNETTFLGIIGLVSFYKIPIFLVDETKKTYLKYHLLDDSENDNECETNKTKTCILYKNTSLKGFTKYKMKLSGSTETDLEDIKQNMLCLEHYAKPLRAISTYKVCELEQIAELLGISTDKLKKPELYAKITEYCM